MINTSINTPARTLAARAAINVALTRAGLMVCTLLEKHYYLVKLPFKKTNHEPSLIPLIVNVVSV
jgi:hypothetical protein